MMHLFTAWLAMSFRMQAGSQMSRSVGFVMSMSTSTDIAGNNNMKKVILVSKKSEADDALISSLAKHMKCDVVFSDSTSSLSDLRGRNSSKRTIVALDAKCVQAKDAASLRALNSIYVMHQGEQPDVEGNTAARDSCRFDLYLDDVASSSARINKLLEKLSSREPPSEEDTLLDAGTWSHFVSLTFPSIDEALPKLPLLRIGADALELRVDLLQDISTASLHRQIALLQDSCPLPIVFTVRSVGQIGRFPPDPVRIFALLREGLRAGLEWIDVEACWPKEHVEAFTALAAREYGLTSRLLGSLHVTTPQTREEIDDLFAATRLNGKAHILKTVTGAAGNDDCERIHVSGEATNMPYIGVCLGALGSRSRVLNRRFTPVTHECMAVAAPGQLTVKQLMAYRAQDGLCEPKKYFLFGAPIQQSLSPAMHNGAYQALALPHVYGLNEQTDVHEYKQLLFHDSSFGGASVTIPHKESIIPMLDDVRGAAKQIGAVNTIVVEQSEQQGAKRRLVGYNTDWLGIKRPLVRQLQKKGGDWNSRMDGKHSSHFGLVVGAGGTARAACYAVKDLGLELLVMNRSPEKGQEIAKMFGGRYVADSDVASFDWRNLQVVVSTVPALAKFTLPPEILSACSPVVLDVVYKPARTLLIEQAMAHDCLIVQGASMLLEQGLEQFELWNKRRAPRGEMDAAVFGGVERL